MTASPNCGFIKTGPSSIGITLCLMIILTTTGCEDADPQTGSDMGEDCQVHGCSDGRVCLANGQCVLPSQAVTISMSIQPPADTGLMVEQVQGLLVGPDSPRLNDIQLSQPTTVTGTVYLDALETVRVEGARVACRMRRGIDNAPITRTVITGEDGRYSIDLVPATYQITVYADDSSIPPFRLGDQNVSGGTFHLDIALPDPSSYYAIQGRLVRVDSRQANRSNQSGSNQVPVVGARVILESLPDGIKVSTDDVTDLTGRFLVYVPPGEREYFVRVSPSGENALVPNLSLPPMTISESEDLGILVVGEWGDPIQLSGEVHGAGGDGQTISGSTLVFESQIELGSFSQLTQTDAQGQFSVSLIPGSYRVTVVPPVDEPWAASELEESWEQTFAGQIFELPTKPHLLGIVRDNATLEGVSRVVITATPTSFPVHLLSLGAVSTESDENGLFMVPVHPGLHRLIVEPLPASGLSPVVIRGLPISIEGLSLNLRLQDSGSVSGRILTPDGNPLHQGIIQLYLETSGTEGARAVLFTESTTDLDGEFSFNLPILGLP